MSNSTTLTTFMLQTSKDVFSVELLGSWDNFDKPYRLNRDKRAGKGQWTGCHRFDNITCDGDLSDIHLKRDGALKMGGTYWYFYRLNGDIDFHDSREPFTTTCPSLPGQIVNVLEVPVLAPPKTSHARESLDALVFTLDPNDKYTPLGVKRAVTTSAIRERKTPMSGELSRGNEGRGQPHKENDASACDLSTNCEAPRSRQQKGLQSAFQKLRRTKSSAGSEGTIRQRPGSSWSRRLFSRARTSKAKAEEEVPQVPEVPLDLLKQYGNRSPTTLASPVSPQVIGGTGPEALVQVPTAKHTSQGGSDHLSIRPEHSSSPPPATIKHDRDASPTSGSPRRPSVISDSRDPVHPLDEGIVDADAPQMMGIAMTTTNSTASGANPACAQSTSESSMTDPDGLPDSQVANNSSYEPENGQVAYAESEALSYTSTDYCTPCLTSNTATSRRMSSLAMSEPATPQLVPSGEDSTPWQRRSDSFVNDDCVGVAVAPSTACDLDPSMPTANPHVDPDRNEHEGFQGYSLPLRDHASSVTIRKLTSHENRPPLPLHRQTSMQLVQSWDDGAQHHLGGLPNLMNDLGYLGTVIS